MSNLEQKIDTLTGSMSTVASAVARVEGWCEEHGRLHVHINDRLGLAEKGLAGKRGKDSDPPTKPVNRWQAFGQALAAVPAKTYLAIVAITFALCMSVSAKVGNGDGGEVVAAIQKHKTEILEIFNAAMDAHDELAEIVTTRLDQSDTDAAPVPVADEPETPTEEEP